MTRENQWTPLYHFWAPEARHYPFDPNGAIFWKGVYHIFYLFQDETVAPGQCNWGHASSVDLVNWQFHPAALSCDHPGESYMFSGSAFITQDGRPTLMYHSVGQGSCLAFAEDDELIVWHKSEHNPVIRELRPEDPAYNVYHVFDPHTWLEGGQYYTILGGRAKPYQEYDTAYLFCSGDLVHWQYCRPFYQATDRFSERYDDCACPDFFRLGDSWVLLCISHTRGARYYLGDYIEHTFVPRFHHRLNFPGGSLFAPESLLDDRQRRICWFWMASCLDESPERPPMREIWALPRELKLSEDGRQLLQFVPQEFAALCGTPETWTGGLPQPGGRLLLPYRSRNCKITVHLTLNAGIVTMDLLSDDDGGECLTLQIDPIQKVLTLDHSRTRWPQRPTPYVINCGAPEANHPRMQQIPWDHDGDGNYRFDIYLDRSIVEVFSADGRHAASQLVYPKADCDRCALRLSPDADATLHSLTFFAMKAAVMQPAAT